MQLPVKHKHPPLSTKLLSHTTTRTVTTQSKQFDTAAREMCPLEQKSDALIIALRNFPARLKPDRHFNTCHWWQGRLTLSMSSGRPSGMGTARMNRRLCLLGDFDRHIWLDSALTVSRYDTTGSDTLMGMQAWSSSRSFRQISKWSSPAPAMMCSPDSSMEHCAQARQTVQ